MLFDGQKSMDLSIPYLGASRPNQSIESIMAGTSYPGPLETGPLPYGANLGSTPYMPSGLQQGAQFSMRGAYQGGQDLRTGPLPPSLRPSPSTDFRPQMTTSASAQLVSMGFQQQDNAMLRSISSGHIPGQPGPSLTGPGAGMGHGGGGGGYPRSGTDEDLFVASGGFDLDLHDPASGLGQWPGSLPAAHSFPPTQFYQASQGDYMQQAGAGFMGWGEEGNAGLAASASAQALPGLGGMQRVESHTSVSSLGTSPAVIAGLFGEHPQGEHPSRTLFVRNLSSQVEEDELRQLFAQFGEIRSVYMACKNRGFVMISYYDIRAAKAAMKALQGYMLRKRRFDIHYSIPKENPSERDVNQGTLVIFNLPPEVTNDELLELFSKHGEVKEIRETPNKRHHKFVEFYDLRAAVSALKALNRAEIRGKTIKLEPSRPGGTRRAGLGGPGASPSSSAAATASPFQTHAGLPGLTTTTTAAAAAAAAAGPGSMRAARDLALQEKIMALGMQQRSKSSNDLVGYPGFSGAAAAAAAGSYESAAAALSRACESSPDMVLLWNQVMAGAGGSSGGTEGPPPPTAQGPGSSTGLAAALANNAELVAAARAAIQQSAGAQTLGRRSEGDGEGFSWEGGEGFYGGTPGYGGSAVEAAAAAAAFTAVSMQRQSLAQPGPRPPAPLSPPPRPLPGALHDAAPAAAHLQLGVSFGNLSLSHRAQASSQPAPLLAAPPPANDPSNAVDIERILRDQDPRTTLMIRNIPNKYTRELLLRDISAAVMAADPALTPTSWFDFFYLPVDFRNSCNVGYAFINVRSPRIIPCLVTSLHNRKWAKYNSDKVCQLCYARIQGKEALVKHFRNSSLLHEDAQYRPVVAEHGATGPLTEHDVEVADGHEGAGLLLGGLGGL